MDHLYDGAHRTASLRSAGLLRSDLDGALWRRPHRGVRSWAGNATGPLLRVREAAAVLPAHGAVGGWAAALLRGAAEFDGEDAGGTELPVPLCVGPGHAVRRRAGIRLSSSALPEEDVERLHGLRLTTPARTAFDVLRWSASVRAAVVAAERLERRGVLPAGEVAGLARARRRWQGAAQVGRALELVRAGTLSSGESRLRLLWTLDAGLPEPRVNHRVIDRRGASLGVPDLLEPASGLVAEYDGAHHREAGRHGADNVREELLEAHGLVVVRVVAADLAPAARERTVARLRAGHHRALALPRGARCWVDAGPWRP
ncbi:hypothetical protein NUM3379_05120 [Kineococcus sp. NUM-3379]